MKIQVLGSGCASCKNLHKTVEEVVKKLHLDTEVEYSTDITKIIEIGAMSSPVFAIDGKLITAGKVPSPQEIEDHITSKISENSCCVDKDVCDISCAPSSKQDPGVCCRKNCS
jgi:small redox-active disulfide protein 2